jgi:hypothetical protein
MDELTYDNFIDKFLEAFPELKETAADTSEKWHSEPDNEPLRYVFMAYVINRVLFSELATMKNTVFLKRIFHFFERMASSTDDEVKDLLAYGTLEHFGDDETILKNARSLMGVNTLLLSHETEIGWGRE